MILVIFTRVLSASFLLFLPTRQALVEPKKMIQQWELCQIELYTIMDLIYLFRICSSNTTFHPRDARYNIDVHYKYIIFKIFCTKFTCLLAPIGQHVFIVLAVFQYRLRKMKYLLRMRSDEIIFIIQNHCLTRLKNL